MKFERYAWLVMFLMVSSLVLAETVLFASDDQAADPASQAARMCMPGDPACAILTEDQPFDPVKEMQSFKEEIKERFHKNIREGFSKGCFDEFGIDTAFFYMSTDMMETADEYIFKVDMPGMKKEDIAVWIKDERLFIKAERKHEEMDDSSAYLKRERRFGLLAREFRLPQNIRDNKISARYDNGVLSITIPKLPEAAPKEQARQISVL